MANTATLHEPRTGSNEPTATHGWTFLTNHAHVLLSVASDPEARLREIAQRVGITERAVHRILVELTEAGYVTPVREGRRNRYEVHGSVPLRHPIERHRTVDALLALVQTATEAPPNSGSGRPKLSPPSQRRRAT